MDDAALAMFLIILLLAFIIAAILIIKTIIGDNDNVSASSYVNWKPKKLFDNLGNLWAEMENLYHFVLYYPNGAIEKEITYKDGKYILTCYSNEGVAIFISELYTYINYISSFNIKLNGQAQGYYPNGHLKCVGKYDYGKLNGKMDFFYDNGDLFITLKFKDDMPVSGSIYSPEGIEKELTIAHINNIMVDHGIGNVDVDFSWVKELLTNEK